MIRTAADFGSEVRKRRKALGWTQAALAEKAGTGERFVIDLEAGKPGCHLEKALTVACTVGLALTEVAASASNRASTDAGSLDFLPVLGQARR